MVQSNSFPPNTLRVVKRRAGGYVVAKNDEVWSQQSPVLGRGGVGELEAVGAPVEGDVEGKGLIEVAEGGIGWGKGGVW